MKKILISFSIVVGIIIILVIIPSIISINHYKENISEAVKVNIGRVLTINGDVKFTLLPQPSLTLYDARLSNPEGFTSAEMLSFSQITLLITNPLSLMDNVVDIEEIRLKNPHLILEKKAEGKVNWAFEKPAAEAASADQVEKQSSSKKYYLNKLFIDNGSISYINAEKKYELADINAKFALSLTDDILASVTSFRYGERYLNSVMTLKDLRNLLAGNAGGISLSISEHASKAAVIGNLIIKDGKISIYKSQFTAGSLKAKGDMEIDYSSSPIAIKAQLTADTPLQQPVALQAASEPQEAASAKQHTGWDTATINVDLLKKCAIQLDYTGPLQTKSVTIDDSELHLAVKEGVLTLESKKLQLYGGNAKIHASIDANGAIPAFQALLVLSNVDADKLLAGTKMTFVSGLSNGTLELASQGRSQKELIEALEGEGSFIITKGAVKGINMATLNRLSAQALPIALPVVKNASNNTSFDKVAGSFEIDAGIIENNDLILTSNTLTIDGNGEINLPQYTVNYRFNPSSEVVNLSVEDIGISIKGRLDNPTISLDAAVFIEKNLPKAKAEIKKVGKKLKRMLEKF